MIYISNNMEQLIYKLPFIYQVNISPDDTTFKLNLSLLRFGNISPYETNVKLNLTSPFQNKYIVNWGDYTTSYIDNCNTEITHKYNYPGVYTIRISEVIEEFKVNPPTNYWNIHKINKIEEDFDYDMFARPKNIFPNFDIPKIPEIPKISKLSNFTSNF